jgi:hypothetical protein
MGEGTLKMKMKAHVEEDDKWSLTNKPFEAVFESLSTCCSSETVAHVRPTVVSFWSVLYVCLWQQSNE